MKHTEDFEIELDDGRFLYFIIEISSWGCGPTMPSWNYAGDPGEGPEWEIAALDIAPDERAAKLADYKRVPVLTYIGPWWRELWATLMCEPITRLNPEWMALEKIATAYVEKHYDFVPPEMDYFEDYDR